MNNNNGLIELNLLGIIKHFKFNEGVDSCKYCNHKFVETDIFYPRYLYGHVLFCHDEKLNEKEDTIITFY